MTELRAGNRRLLMVDNYDSFTYNVVQYLGQLGQQVVVVRNDEISVGEILRQNFAAVVISPGPCTPNEAGISLELIDRLQGRVPILGICLGHQAIAQCFGADIVRAAEPVHGKLADIVHDGKTLFRGIDSPFAATRYHSLAVAEERFPDCLEISAWAKSADGRQNEIMGLRHRHLQIEGVQFHPESIATQNGHQLLANFLQLAGLPVETKGSQ